MKPAGDELRPDGGEPTAGYPRQEQLIDVRRVDRPDAVVVAVSGAVDILTAPRLRAAFAVALEHPDGRPVIVDLADVRFFGSPGLRVLAESAEQASAKPGFQPLRVVVDSNRPVIRPIELTGYDAILALYHGQQQHRARLPGPRRPGSAAPRRGDGGGAGQGAGPGGRPAPDRTHHARPRALA